MGEILDLIHMARHGFPYTGDGIVKVDLAEHQIDEDNYGYAVCTCMPANEGLRIVRPEHTTYI